MASSREEVKKILRDGYVNLPNLETQPFSVYHNPETGKEFPRLPADSYSASNYLRRGLRLGAAPK